MRERLLVWPRRLRLQWRMKQWQKQDAASAVEYAIMAGFIAAVMIVAAVFLGEEAKGTYDCTKESIESSDARC